MTRRHAIAVIAATAALAGCSPHTSAVGSVPPSLAASPASLPSLTPSAAPTPVKPRVSKIALAYFFQIALGQEYADKQEAVVVKWMKPVVTVRTDGTVSSADRACLAKVIADFNALTPATDLRLSSSAPSDIVMHFASASRFRALEPTYVRGNDGFFHTTWSGYELKSANILIRTTGITGTLRCHLIREELTQSMGLMKDSNQYADSIFYGRPSMPTRYSALDKQLISLLYNEAIRPGSNKEAVAAAVEVLP